MWQPTLLHGWTFRPAQRFCAGKAVLFDIAITYNRVRLYYTPTGRFVRKSHSVDFKVHVDSKFDCVVDPSMLSKKGIKGRPGQETTWHSADSVRKIGCSSLLTFTSWTMVPFRSWIRVCIPTSISTITSAYTKAWTTARRRRCTLREWLLDSVDLFIAAAPVVVVIRRDWRYNVIGSREFFPGQPAGLHLIFTDPWSKGWGQPHSAAEF